MEPTEPRVYTTHLAGRPLVVEIGELARQANGAALVRYGDTVVLVTATASRQPREGVDFLPLRVDWEERLYAAGRIPHSFFRREGRPSERAILSGRLTDRPLRPLFPKGFRNDVQIVVTTLSYDDDNLPEIGAIFGASTALCISDIPFERPVAAVMVGRVDGQFVLNPTEAQRDQSDLELWVAGTDEAILMIECGAREVPEEVILDAVFFGHEAIKELVAFQRQIVAEVGRPKMDVPLFTVPEEIRAAVEEYREAMRTALRNPDKQAREAAVEALKEEARARLAERFPDQDAYVAAALHDLEKDVVRRGILDEGIRPDGRRPEEIRPIRCRVGLLPRAHGSGLFTRGQTQVLTVASLGSVGDRQTLDTLGAFEEQKRFMHHYNFPPYSVGEVQPIRAPGRREIGHGALAERALLPVIPDENDFPYTIRLVSEVLESNGSTSMGSVCGSTLALMDAGVPIKAPVSGIAMGLIKEGDRVAILSDIQGIEDQLGDMDFKVAGTERGVTAIQLDIKIPGIDRPILERALRQAREGRLHILRKMLEVIDRPRPELSPYAPRMIILQINPERIRDVIGPGGRVINRITSECDVQIDIEDDGRVFIAAQDMEGGLKAKEWIERLTRDVQVGEIFVGRVTRLLNFGAFVELWPGKEGLVHVSQLSTQRVPRIEDFVKPGDILAVKVVEIDELGRVNVSRREALKERPELRDRESLSPALRSLEQGGAPPDDGRAQGRAGGPAREGRPGAPPAARRGPGPRR